MLQKLTAFSLSLLICFSLLPSQAGAMDAPEDESPVQVEDVENQTSPEDPDAGIAPCTVVMWSPLDGGGGAPAPRPSGPGANDQDGSGNSYGVHPEP